MTRRQPTLQAKLTTELGRLGEQHPTNVTAIVAMAVLGYIGANAHDSWAQLGVAAIVAVYAMLSTEPSSGGQAESRAPQYELTEFLRRR